MIRDNLNDLVAFVAVAREGSFTKAAAKLGVSQSALSHTIKGLEKRLGIRLLARSTRSVSPTEAGQRLLVTVGPRIDEIENEISIISEVSGKPSGTIRITTPEHAVIQYVWPKIESVLKKYPDINLEISFDNKLVDIVAERYDMGIRIGESVPKDMVAIRISPELEMAAVATPEYFKSISRPKIPEDLKNHNCINLRLPTYGGLYIWDFSDGKNDITIRVKGQLIFSSASQIKRACLAGLGIAYLPYDMMKDDVEQGKLIRVLSDWCPPFPGYHIYYPNRREPSSAFTTIIEALRHRD